MTYDNLTKWIRDNGFNFTQARINGGWESILMDERGNDIYTYFTEDEPTLVPLEQWIRDNKLNQIL